MTIDDDAIMTLFMLALAGVSGLIILYWSFI